MLLNQSRAREFMRRYRLDALVVTSPINITYFSDYYCWIDSLFKEYMGRPGATSNLSQAYAVFPLEGEPALTVTPLFAVNAADIWVRDLRLFGDPGLDMSIAPRDFPGEYQDLFRRLQGSRSNATSTDAVLSVLQERGLSAGRIGLEMEGLPKTLREAIERALPRAEIADCSNLIRLIRMVKSPEEISNLIRSAEISEQAAMESLAMARRGRPFRDVVRHYRERVADNGAAFDHFTFSIRGLGIAAEPDYILRDDDVLSVDFGCIYRHYFSDSGATLAMCALSSDLSQRYAALRACIASGTETLRPGVKASRVPAAMWQPLKEHGVTASFPHGHSLGLEVRDYPILVADNGLKIQDGCVNVDSDLLLEANMVINLEASFFVPGVGSVQIEKSFLITSDGNVPLVPQDRTAPVHPD
jgi:Xaa-Pro aminopeptidase